MVLYSLDGEVDKGLWRVEPQGEAKLIIPDVEPWQIVAEGRNVWVATIANGLWASEEGQPFEQVSTGSVTAISRVGNAVWMALPRRVGRCSHTRGGCNH